LYPLIQFFVDLCLLRRAPQDLPVSNVVFGLALAADLLVGMLLGVVANLSLLIAFAEGVVDVFFSLTLLYLALRFLDRLPRFQQTATALLGAAAVLGFAAILPLSLFSDDGSSDQSALAVLLFLAVIVWSLLVTGHILRHSFDLRLGQGVVVAVAYNFLSYTLVSGLFSGS